MPRWHGRREDARLLTGRGRFTADIAVPGQAYGAVVRSPHAHAEVVAVDPGPAWAIAGVLAVLTAADAESAGIGSIPTIDDEPLRAAGAEPRVASPQPVLARGRVRYVGEPVAFVVAETIAAARSAAEALSVTYRPLPAVTEAARALDPASPDLWPGAPGNLALERTCGDDAAARRASAAAPHLVTIEVVNQRLMALPLEPLAIVAVPEAAEGRLTLVTPSQGVHDVRRLLAGPVLGMAELRVVTPDVGGAFGIRGFPLVEHALVAWAARRLGRPVRWTAERGESVLAEPQARDHVCRATLALDGDGRFLALTAETVANLGAYASPIGRLIPALEFANAVTGPYRIAAAWARVRCVFTNTQPTTAYRGAGQPEALYLLERLIDAAAHDLGFDRLDLRRRNLLRAGDMPYRTALDVPLEAGDPRRALASALAKADAEGFDVRRTAAASAGARRGLGVACYVMRNEGVGMVVPAALQSDGAGGVALLVGGRSSGQGHETVLSRLVAERLGIDETAVSFVQDDSARIPDGPGTGGSTGMVCGGGAVLAAGEALIAAILPAAAERLEVATADVVFADGAYRVVGTDRRLAFAEAARAAGPLAVEARNEGADSCSSGCHVCEVEVDPATGRVEIVAYTAVDDAGRLVAPRLAAGQIHGGVAQGLGQAFLERCVYDSASGQLLTGSLLDYALPRAADLPALACHFEENPSADNPLGAKGVGEAGTVAAPPALVNAVADALGLRHIDMPLTPERVWRALSGTTA